MAEIGPPIAPAFPQHGGNQALDWVEPLLGGDWRRLAADRAGA
jgi:hypothetical protein